MKLTKCNINDIYGLTGYNAGLNQRIIEEFLESGFECAKVEDWSGKSAASKANSLNGTITKQKFHGVKAISRKKYI